VTRDDGRPAIEIAGVGKRYVKYEDTPMLVSRVLRLRSRTRRSALWALRGIDFSVPRGECFGVIGRNGSGKSTLLQMLAGVTAPTEGKIAVNGRVAPLIAVGVGFHPELSGRENVYVNGMILGLTRTEINDRFDEIVEFSEIGPFIDTPVKFYSSGMFVRLGFSVAVLADPDILLIDEVLAVGDMAFQLKCFERVEQIRANGATIAIVSHNLNAVRRLCSRTIVIHDGAVRFDGDTVEAIALYHELLGASDETDDPMLANEHRSVGAGDLERIELLGADGEPTRHIGSGGEMTLEVVVRFRRPFDTESVLGVTVLNEAGIHVYGESWLLPMGDGGFAEGDLVQMRVGFRPELATGSYSLQANVATFDRARLTALPSPILFFAAGRHGVRGIADLKADFRATVQRDAPEEQGISVPEAGHETDRTPEPHET
jgi:ABC-type polysaccharide/polyol phosphate transport system ATPase subunit